MDGKVLVREARRVMEGAFENKDIEPEVEGAGGAFVTLLKGKDLRGCIGIPVSADLKYALKQAALGVLRDPRFPPVRKEELEHLTVEVSVLSPPVEVKDPLKEIRVGEHGIIIRRGWNSGLLLPQVPVEQKWNLEEFLDYGCLKAGLKKGCWKEKGTQVFRFSARVFKERTPKGEVLELHLEGEPQ